jgi:uncharacterized SAM-binding protein YcdF (DUF218 family)
MTVALILGAAVWPDGPSPTLRRRTELAARLWHDGTASHLVPCGGTGTHPPAEAFVMRDLLLTAGVPDHCITPEAASTTTAENIAFALPILKALNATRVLIVTDWYHAPRARLTARRFGLDPVSRSPGLHGTRPLAQLRLGLREIPALAVYWWRIGR